MKRLLVLILATASCTLAQEKRDVIYQTVGVAGTAVSGGFDRPPEPIVGAPYSATIANESIEVLADGNRIVHKSTGTTARDSQGRTRQDIALPAIGNLSAANAPHLIFIHDPVARASYTLNLTEKTAQKLPAPPPMGAGVPGIAGATISMRVVEGNAAAPVPLPPPDADAMPVTIDVAGPGPGTMASGAFFEKHVATTEQNQGGDLEDLGSQTMEGVAVTGVRTTHTIPAGEIGNEKPITIVTEVWNSPELKTVVYSKRSDPRMGERTFRLTNIVRAEPSASLFAVPSDFKIVDGPQKTIVYKTKQ